MESRELLEKKVSYQNYFWSAIEQVSLKAVLSEIKGEKHSRFTNYLRELYRNEQKELYGIKKRKLPVVTFSASFENERIKETLKEYNFLVVLDIDKLGSIELQRVKQQLLNEDYVFTFWLSPSSDGIKGLVHLKYNFDITTYGIDYSHKIAFNQLVKYFYERHGVNLDKNCSDVTRLCFISYDKDLILKSKIASFEVQNIPAIISEQQNKHTTVLKTHRSKISKDILFNPYSKNKRYQRETIKNIIKFLQKESNSITYKYEDWLRVAFAISNSFTFDIGLKYFIELSKLDRDKFIEDDCRRFLNNCYEYSRGKIGFNTIIHMASEQGFKYKDINAEST